MVKSIVAIDGPRGKLATPDVQASINTSSKFDSVRLALLAFKIIPNCSQAVDAITLSVFFSFFGGFCEAGVASALWIEEDRGSRQLHTILTTPQSSA